MLYLTTRQSVDEQRSPIGYRRRLACGRLLHAVPQTIEWYNENMSDLNADGTTKFTRHYKRDLAKNPETTTWHRKPTKKLRYFYTDGKLHKVIHVNRAADVATTFCYPDGEYRQYPWAWLKKNYERAYGMQDVANLVQRHRRWIQRKMLDGDIRKPQKAYSLKNPDRYTYYFSENDILEVQDYFANQHIGFKRKDGLITPAPTPSKYDLKAMMNDGAIMYVKGEGDTFVPVWRETENY